MIDIKTGSIIFDKGITINQNSDFDSVYQMKLGEIQEVNDMGNGWKWLCIKNVSISGRFFVMSFAFKDLTFKELSFTLSEEKFDLNSNWSNWNEKEEFENLKKYQDWLDTEIGKNHEFKWGKFGRNMILKEDVVLLD